MAEQDYCQYIISKCAAKACAPATNGVFRITKAFLDSYENSQNFSEIARVRDRRISEWTAELINEQINVAENLGIDALCHSKEQYLSIAKQLEDKLAAKEYEVNDGHLLIELV